MSKRLAMLISSVICVVLLLNGCDWPDIESPMVSITYPGDGDTVSGVVTITATATDNKGVIRVEFYIDDSLEHTDTDEPYSYEWDTSTLPDSSSHTIMARAYDEAENIGESDVINVIVIRKQMTLELVGQLVFPDFSPSCVAISGSYAYLTSNRLKVIDISNPASPVEVWSGLEGMSGHNPMLIKDNYLYVLNSSEGKILDITNPASPESAGVFNDGDTLWFIGEGDIYGDYLFTGTGTTWSKHYFVVWDIIDPTSPTPVGSYSTGSGYEWIYDVKVSPDGNYAYLAVGGYGLRVMDVSSPGSPYEVGSLELGGGAIIEIYGSYLFLACDGDVSNRRIVVIDISNPASPTELSSFGGDTYAMALSYPYLYYCHGWELYVVDVSNPLSVTDIASYFGGEFETGSDIALSGNYIYVAWTGQGLVILELKQE